MMEAITNTILSFTSSAIILHLLVDNLRSGLAFKKPSKFEPTWELAKISVIAFTSILFCAVSIVLFANVSASDAIVETASIFSCESIESATSLTLCTSALSRKVEKCAEASRIIAGLIKILAVQITDKHKKTTIFLDLMTPILRPYTSHTYSKSIACSAMTARKTIVPEIGGDSTTVT